MGGRDKRKKNKLGEAALISTQHRHSAIKEKVEWLTSRCSPVQLTAYVEYSFEYSLQLTLSTDLSTAYAEYSLR